VALYVRGESNFQFRMTSADKGQNKHHLGDQWNGEDLSIFSLDDQPLPVSALPSSPMNASTASLVDQKTGRNYSDEATVNPANLRSNLKTPSISSKRSESPPEISNTPGFRAAEAYVRPSPIAALGTIIEYGFDLRNCTFSFKFKAHKATSDEAATEIILPDFHFPKDKCEVEVSAGKWTLSTDDHEGALIQKLKWWHAEGEHSIKVTGILRVQQMGREDDPTYLEQCQPKQCIVM
jgi:hypothetical protein